MIDFQKAEKRAKELRDLLNFYSHRYYMENESDISDFEYDKLMGELENIEKAFPELQTDDSPTLRVGGKADTLFSPVFHEVPMESLQDVFNDADLRDFDRRVKEVCKDAIYVVEPKIDGLSVSLEYRDSVFVRGSTRGDGLIGEDVTANLRTLKTIPLRLQDDIPFLVVRGEVFMSYDSFDEIVREQELNGKQPFKNPRNAASGSLRQKNPKITAERNLSVYVFNVQQIEGKNISSHSESLEFLKEAGLNVIPDYSVCSNIDEVIAKVNKIGEMRGNFPFNIDGAVIKVNDFEQRKSLGSTSKFPKWAAAFKYPAEEKESKLLSIEINVGRTGVLTPTGVFEPILLDGSTVSRATLHNQDFIDEKDIRIGDICVLRKAGDIIPEVVEVVSHSEGSAKYEMPKNCPSCDSLTIREKGEAALRCTNPDCPAQILRLLIHFCSRDAMDIVGLGVVILETLVGNKIIFDAADIYEIQKSQLLEIERFGEKSADNLIKAIEKSKSNDFARLIFALGIRNIGQRAARLLAEHFHDIDSIMAAKPDEILNIEGFGETMANSVYNYFLQEQSKTLIDRFKKSGLNMTYKSNMVDTRFAGQTFVLTGTLESLKRDEAAKIIESYGGKTSSSVSKKTSMVLAGSDAGSKLKKAKDLNIKVITEEEFIEMTK